MLRLVGYVRVSHVGDREGDSFISPSVQREQIERYAALKGYTVVEVIEDLDQSGGKADRPGFQRGLEMIERREVDGFACAKLDRFARSVIDGREALQRINAAGGELVLVAEGLDTNTPMGKAMFMIMLVFAELELDRIRENFVIARDRAIARGVPVSPYVKIGYRKTEAGTLEPDPETAPIVREIFARRGRDESWRSICRYLDETIGGGWTITTAMGIVKSRMYLGELSHGQAVNLSAHEPLVTRAEWQAAQQAAGLREPRRVGSLLAGTIRCAACGYTMSRETSGRRFGETQYWRYGCRKLHAGGRCPAPTSIAGPAVDEHVEAAFLARLAIEPSIVEPEPIEISGTAALVQLEAAEAELVAYRDTELVSVIGADAYRQGLTERVRVVNETQQLLAGLRRGLAPTIDRDDLLASWHDRTLEERRRAIAAGIDVVYVKRSHLGRRGTPVEDRIRILFAGEGPDVLPGRGSEKMLAPFVF